MVTRTSVSITFYFISRLVCISAGFVIGICAVETAR